LTLWYGSVLCVILVFFSGASYLRYRAAAWKAFDAGLHDDLGSLQGALEEEIAEARHPAEAEPVGRPVPEPWRLAATQAIEEFRLNGLSAEIRRGGEPPTVLARLSVEGDTEDASILPESAWRDAARTLETRSFALAEGRRGLVRGFQPEGESEPIVIAVAGGTTLVEETLGSIRRALLEFGAAGFLLAVAGGYWLATRALLPIDTMTRQAGGMAAASPPTALRRLDVRNAGDELGRLASTFNLLLERIESSMAWTKGFVADAAHELKTPVAIVRTGAELALSGDRSPDEYRDALRAICLESTHLSDLVSDLTLLAEGELLEQPLERRLVDLSELVHEVARSLGSVAAGRGVRIEIEAPQGLEYRGDERLLRRAAVNLLENAIKFSAPGARVGVCLFLESGQVKLHVLDEAHTLSPAERGRVFERFYRSQRSRSDGVPGSGLGLAIVQWAVTLHGGRVRVEPREPVGNTFVIEFPAS
jgi:signal transduction histidine kinase